MTKKRKIPRIDLGPSAPVPKLLKKTKSPPPRKGFISLQPVEVEVFLEMKAESQNLEIARAQLQAREQALLKRHNKIVVALAKARQIDCRIKVLVNENATGLNYEEVKDDSAEGDAARAGPKT